MCKARECYQNCPLCNNSTQLPKIKVPERYISTEALDIKNSNGVVTEGSWRRDIATIPFASVPNSQKGKQPRKAEETREQLCDYLNGPGQVSWQWIVVI